MLRKFCCKAKILNISCKMTKKIRKLILILEKWSGVKKTNDPFALHNFFFAFEITLRITEEISKTSRSASQKSFT